MTVLPVQLHHALHVSTLPRYHRDPFDRILIAQSQVESLPLVTVDAKISRYAVDIIW
jgi:PIN domain nuclease of toxin-antitoxin system